MRFFTPSDLARPWRYQLACALMLSLKQYITAARLRCGSPPGNAGREPRDNGRLGAARLVQSGPCVYS